MEAMEKLKSGQRFSEVAAQYSEDKARQGVSAAPGTGQWGRAAPAGAWVLLVTTVSTDPSRGRIAHHPCAESQSLTPTVPSCRETWAG